VITLTLKDAAHALLVAEALRIAAKEWDADAGHLMRELGGTSQQADDLIALKFKMAADARVDAGILEHQARNGGR
jgi:hypothetical protein